MLISGGGSGREGSSGGEQDERLWQLAICFSFIVLDQNKSFDIYKALSRMENQYLKKSYITDILTQLYEHDVKASGKYGKLYCNEKGRWIYKQDRMFLKSSSMRFLGQGIGSMKRSFRTLSVEEQVPPPIPPAPPAAATVSPVDPKLLRRFSTTDAKCDSPSSPDSDRTPASDSQPSPLEDRKPRSLLRRKSGVLHSLSARTVLTLSDESAGGVPFDQLYSPRDDVPSGANLPYTEQSEIILEALWEELLPAMIIYESFLQLGAAWLGDGSSTSVAASQRRLLQKVNSRTAILNTTNLIDQMKQDRTTPAASGAGSPPPSPRGGLSRTVSNASLLGSDDVNIVRTIDTDLLNELLNDIEENAMIHMPDIVIRDQPQPLPSQASTPTANQGDPSSSRLKSNSSARNLFSDKSPVSTSKHTKSDPPPLTPSPAGPAADRGGRHGQGRQGLAVHELNRQDSLPSDVDSDQQNSKDSFPGRGSSTQDTPRSGAGTGGESDDQQTTTKSLRFAPSVPLKRPSWNSPTTPMHFARKRRPGMVVRLALSQSGPFQKLLREGVRVVVHCLYPNERRPRRFQRVMILQDSRSRNHSWQSGGGDSSSFDLNDLLCSDSANPKSSAVMKLRFFKFEAGVLLETEDEIIVTNISEILTGVHTAGFKRSLNQLYGEGSSYEKSGAEKRCFSMIGCLSPYDGRHCLDLEIQPVDKQKPEELQAASMISLGVATAIQVMSNLANTKDVQEIGVISSLGNVFKSVHDKSPEESVCESQSQSASVATKNSRNTTPPDSRRDSESDTSKSAGDTNRSAGGTTLSAGGSTATPTMTATSGGAGAGVAGSSDTGGSNSVSSRYNEKMVTSLRLSGSMAAAATATGSPSSLRGKRFNIPTILEAAPPESPGTGSVMSGASRGMKRGASKTMEELGVLNSHGPRHAFEKHRPKSFTLAPTTPLTPAIMSLFDGHLPPEQFTINYIMQEVVELWTAGEAGLHDDDTING